MSTASGACTAEPPPCRRRAPVGRSATSPTPTRHLKPDGICFRLVQAPSRRPAKPLVERRGLRAEDSDARQIRGFRATLSAATPLPRPQFRERLPPEIGIGIAKPDHYGAALPSPLPPLASI